MHRQGVRAGDDEEITARASFDRRADLVQVFLAVHHSLATQVSAPLGPDLILQETARRIGRDQLANRAEHVQRVAVTRVGVDDHRDGHAAADVACTVDHFGLRQQPQVRLADKRRGHRVAGNEGQRKTGLLGKLRRQRIVNAGKGRGANFFQNPVDACLRHRWASSHSAESSYSVRQRLKSEARLFEKAGLLQGTIRTSGWSGFKRGD